MTTLTVLSPVERPGAGPRPRSPTRCSPPSSSAPASRSTRRSPPARRSISPIGGTIVKLHPHAFVVQHDDGRAVLVHLGIDTVELGGAGFTLHAAEGAVVTAGQVVVSWDPSAVAAGGRSPGLPGRRPRGGCRRPHPARATRRHRAAGEPLLSWA